GRAARCQPPSRPDAGSWRRAGRQSQAAIGGEGEACLEPWAYARQWIVQALLSQSLPWAST
ncbi:hypothetical protein, partial [Pseudomonas syringae group genomosp. 3]|uniref:hypothetical protein n=1 Tax=Pseudomonas syringae group genomosp. 3 TaxID=251701 RepID=UPI001C615EA6